MQILKSYELEQVSGGIPWLLIGSIVASVAWDMYKNAKPAY